VSRPLPAQYGYGDFSKVARFMTLATGTTWTRQRVYSLWNRRGINGFPDKHSTFTADRTQRIEAFRLEEVLIWYNYRYPTKRWHV
jgi:hypothetical protein